MSSNDAGMTRSAGNLAHEGSAAHVSAVSLEDGTTGLFHERSTYTENVFTRIQMP